MQIEPLSFGASGLVSIQAPEDYDMLFLQSSMELQQSAYVGTFALGSYMLKISTYSLLPPR